MSRSSFQKLDEAVRLFAVDVLQVKRRRHISEPFAHPLIAIRTEADGVAPPLMRHLVRGHNLPVAAVAPLHAELVAHGGVEEIAEGYPHEFRPGLSEVAGGLLSDS
jgi:hypothetical protein